MDELSGLDPEKAQRPGGELYGRPVQREGKWYDKFGQEIPLPEPKRREDGKWRDRDGKEISDAVAQDQSYARRFWEGFLLRGRTEGVIPDTIEAMRVSITKAAERGQFGVLVDSHGITEKDKERISAYREVARTMGYQIGPLRFNPEEFTAMGPITKIPDTTAGG